MTSPATPEHLTRRTRVTLIVVVAAILALAATYMIWFWLINGLHPARLTPSAWGEFGDFIGGIANPLVALFALYWLTEAIRVQRQELSEARAILSSQSESDSKRNFESTFFALLSHLNSIHGRMNDRHADEWSDLGLLHREVFKEGSLEDANERLNDENDRCSHYFVTLFQTLKFVASHFQGDVRTVDELTTRLVRSSASNEERFYSGIVRASLDNRTLQLLAVNCFSSASHQSFTLFKVLVERYALFEHMPFAVGSSTNYHEALVKAWTDFYDPRAFGKSDYVAKLRLLGYAPCFVQADAASSLR